MASGNRDVTVVATTTQITAAAVSTLLLDSNVARKAFSVYNTGDDALYLKYGTGAASTSFKVLIDVGGFWVAPTPMYTGVVYGRWGAAITSGVAAISEEM